MNEPKRTLSEMVKTIGGSLAVLTSIFTAIAQFNDTLKKAVDSLGPVAELPIIVWLLVAAILLIVGVFTLRDGLARRSRLLRPEALQLKADNPAHLKGRSEDIERLSTLCHACQQVHLVGESGAGKSALIQAGLLPALKADTRLFPIYLDVWGQDWQEGPRTALTYALWEALSEEDRGTLGLTTLPQPENLVVILDQCRAKLGRTPLLLFDQFDDYQTRHRTRFLSARRRTWISADRLTEANTFWRNVKKLIDDKVVNCLFATRSDTADGLESIRFVDPQVYPLDRLNADFVLPLLTELTAIAEGMAPVVFAPDRGWERLKERLARDLSEDGAVLPVQMKIALQCLARLRSLTVSDYERADRLRGLEAAYVEWRIVNTAWHSGLTEIHVRTLLTSLADAETLKTVPRSTAELAKTITVGNTANPSHLKGAVEIALDDLEKKEIVRRRLDPDTRQHVWVLDHDYLCRGVLVAERRANRWFTLAQERYRTFQDAGGRVWRRWWSLLSPWQQMMLVSQRLRGRFRYGPLRSYAGWSVLRFAPHFLLLAFVIFGWIGMLWWQQVRSDRNKAAQIRAAIGLSVSLSPIELDHLWKLAHSSDAVRNSFFEQALEFPATAEQFNRRADMAVQAAVGLNHERREEIYRTAVLPCLQHPPAHLTIRVAYIRIGVGLSKENDNPQFISFAVKTLPEAISETTEPTQLFALGWALEAVVRGLAAEEAQKLSTHLMRTIERPITPGQPDALAGALKVMIGRLAPTEAQKLSTQLISMIEHTTDPQQFAGLTKYLMVMIGGLAPEEAQKASTHLIAIVERTTDPSQVMTLVGALRMLPGGLTPTEAQRVFTHLIAMIERTTDPWQLWALVVALKMIPGELEPATAQKTLTHIITQIERTSEPIHLRWLTEALKVLSGRVVGGLGSAEAQKIAARLITMIERTTEFNQLGPLAGALETVVGGLVPTQAEKVFAHLVPMIERTTEPTQLRGLAETLKVGGGELASAEAQKVFAYLVTMIERTTEPIQLAPLTEALKTAVGKLGPAEAQKVIARLVAIIEHIMNPYQAGALVEALKLVPGELAPAEVQKVAVHLIAMIERTTEPMHLWTLTEALKAVPGELGPVEIQKIFVQLITLMERITEPNQDMALIGILRAVPGTLDPQQLINLLKWPTSVGARRSTLLSLLEEQTGQKFDRNLWKMVTWAQANSLDVKSPPKRPDK